MSKQYRVEAPIQLAHFLKENIGGSIKGIRRSLEKNCCKVNGQIERFGSRWLQKGNIIEYIPLETAVAKIEHLYVDDDLIIIDKPVNFVCSPENCRRVFGKNISLVHRLDKDTSGALLLAKTQEIKQELIELFATFKIEKEYFAIVDGLVRKNSGVIDTFISKIRTYQGQTIWGSSKNGQRTVTHFDVIKRGNHETLLSLKPVTGRTHQLRVHMAEMGHPILGDRQYAHTFHSKAFASRPLLHASSLRFAFRGKAIEATSPLHSDFFINNCN